MFDHIIYHRSGSGVSSILRMILAMLVTIVLPERSQRLFAQTSWRPYWPHDVWRSKIEIAVILLSWNIPWRLSISAMTACHVNEKTCSKYCTNRLRVTSWSAEAWISGIMSWVCPLTDTLLILMYISDFAVNNDQGISRDISEKNLSLQALVLSRSLETAVCVITKQCRRRWTSHVKMNQWLRKIPLISARACNLLCEQKRAHHSSNN